jgi:chromosome partitioning protein
MGHMAARKTAPTITPSHSTRVITIANNKGGTGKTTTAVNVSAGLAFLKKKRVLLVDFDPQGNASMALGVDIENLRYSVKDLLTGTMTDLHYLCWDKGDNLKILPANAILKDVEPDLLRSVDGRLRLKNYLQPIVEQFDFIIIDTPPTLGVFTQAPLVASTEILIPVDVGYFSLQGIRQLLEEIASVREVFNPALQVKRILLTKFDSRTTLSGQVREILRESFGDDAFKTVINVNVDIVRAQIERKSIFSYDLTSTGAQDYQNVVEELLGNNVAVESGGNVIPFHRKKGKGPGGLKEQTSRRAAKAD